MRRKGSTSTLPRMSLLGIVALLCILIAPTINAQAAESPDSATCQCGVFLLGTGTLTFSADAKPVLAGLPVTANCSASDDKISCATICRQLIQAMSGNQENTPLVQTVVLAATRTLACQRFNESHKIPAPRNFEGTNRQTLAQLDDQNKWKFFVGPSSHGARSDLAAERNGNSQNQGIDGSSNHADQDDENSVALTEPKWLGGYYRWCDEHWIYAGVSLHEPLCCQGHMPKRCPNYQPEEISTPKSSRNGRKPRLIVIKRCPNNICEDVNDDEETDPSSEETKTNKVSPTSVTKPDLEDGEDETEAPETSEPKEEDADNESSVKEPSDDEQSSETINPYTTPTPIPAKPLNATVMSEALKFFETLMAGLGYGEILEGVRSVLPETTAVQLLERVNHGGWLTHYQDRYIKWPREFSMGYCYLEYSMYNVKNEGGLGAATENLIKRIFGPENTPVGVGARLPQPPQTPQSPPPQIPYEPNQELTNYIQPMPQMPGNGYVPYDQYDHSRIPGNRRVRRGVSVSRSYGVSPAASRATGRSNSSNGRPVRRNSVRRVKPQSRTVSLPYETRSDPMFQANAPPVSSPDTSQYVPLQTIQPSHNGGSNAKQSSFVPTHPETSNTHDRHSSQNAFPKVYRNNVPYAFDTYQQSTPVRRSHQENNNNPNLAEIARPRRHPGGGEEIYDDKRSPPVTVAIPTTGTQRGPLGPGSLPPLPPPSQPQRQQSPTPKDGPSAGNFLSLANMLVQTAMAGGGSSEGDKVTNMMQTAIPLVANVANNPAVHSMVSNLVTTFLTPPNPNGPPPPPSRPTRPELNEEWGNNGGSSNNRPQKKPLDTESDEQSNEIDSTISATNTKPMNSRPPPTGGGGAATEVIANVVQNMISSYIKHMFSGPERPSRPPPTTSTSVNQKIDKKPGTGGSTESSDIVDVIANAAKPFFMSFFGVVPGDPGYGRLLIKRKDEFKRYGGDESGKSPSFDILTDDPDPGAGIVDILIGPPNLPSTGNTVYDFGNRVVYAFSNANDPHHGVYCFKQYFVNKVWDYFRLGVRAVFK